jgi:Transposase DDE domain.
MQSLLDILTEEQISKIKCLLADREFIGNEWITYLKYLPFNFFIRIRNNSRVRKTGKHKEVYAKSLFNCQHFKALRKKRVLFGHQLYVGGQKLSDTEWLIIISDIPVKHAKNFYGERWGIEVFFGSCKKRGFNFEDTHVTKLDRISNIIFLIAIAFCWALKTGEFLLDNGHQITIKKIEEPKGKTL